MPQSSKSLLATVDFWKSVLWPGNHACLVPDRNAVWVTAAAFSDESRVLPTAAGGDSARSHVSSVLWSWQQLLRVWWQRCCGTKLGRLRLGCAAAAGSDRRNRACALLSLIPSNSRALPPLRKAGISRSARF